MKCNLNIALVVVAVAFGLGSVRRINLAVVVMVSAQAASGIVRNNTSIEIRHQNDDNGSSIAKHPHFVVSSSLPPQADASADNWPPLADDELPADAVDQKNYLPSAASTTMRPASSVKGDAMSETTQKLEQLASGNAQRRRQVENSQSARTFNVTDSTRVASFNDNGDDDGFVAVDDNDNDIEHSAEDQMQSDQPRQQQYYGNLRRQPPTPHQSRTFQPAAGAESAHPNRDEFNVEYTKETVLKQGRLKGMVRLMHPQSGLRNVDQYLGIPYAAAPVGNGRFMPPGE